MLQADNVAKSLQGNSGKPKVPELPVTIQIGGIENDMIVDIPDTSSSFSQSVIC